MIQVHGANGYKVHKCRCAVCCAANTLEVAKWRARRAGKPVPEAGKPVVVKHKGSLSRYDPIETSGSRRVTCYVKPTAIRDADEKRHPLVVRIYPRFAIENLNARLSRQLRSGLAAK